MTAISDKTAADSHQIIAELKRKLDERTSERDEALERQTATADILKVIASSRSDVQPVFEAIATSAKRLIGGFSTTVFSIVDDVQHLSALTPTSPLADAALKARFPAPLSAQPWAEQIRNGEIVNVADIETESAVPADLRDVWRMRGFRALLLVPLRRDRASIGMISLTRREPGTFAVHDVQLLQTFADQAVIAIENARLFGEVQARTHDLHESLTYQTAISNVLNVISRSPSDILTVLDTIAETAQHLCQSEHAYIFRLDGDNYHLVAARDVRAERIAFLRDNPIAPNRGSTVGRVALERRPIHVMDALADTEYKLSLVGHGGRTILGVPLLRDGIVIGVIVLTRGVVRPFVERQIELVTTFADQAVIAIENTRLFNETQEALERQTATADILKVIASSPSNVQPVFEAIATSSNTLIGGFSTAVMRFIGEELHLAAFTPTNPAADEVLKASFPRPLAEFPAFLLVRDGETMQFADTEAEDVPHLNRDLARLRGFRSMLFTPLISGGTPIGLISVTRKEPGPFAAHHTQLVRTFADQAVIAIENVRLFDEVQAKTRDLTESLQQQTATADVLKVIASSPTEVKPVLDAIVESACKLCEASDAYVALKDGDNLVFQTQHGLIPVAWKRRPINRQWPAGRAVVDGMSIHLHDVLAAEGDEFPDGRKIAHRDGARTVLTVPLMREGESIGVIILRRTEVLPFTDKQIALLQTFADQAVIAIGNVRLFNETREALERQTATSEVLKVIASSPSDLQPVFDAIAERSNHLIGGYSTTVFRFTGDTVELAAFTPVSEEADAVLRATFPRPLSGSHDFEPLSRGEMTETIDAQADTESETSINIARVRGFRGRLVVPLKSDSGIIGAISVTRKEPGAFAKQHVELLLTFADQAVIAIQNARLFNETKEALERQTATADILKVIASSPSDVQPVFDAIAERSKRLVDALSTTVFRFADGMMHLAAFTSTNPEADAALRATFPAPLSGFSWSEATSNGDIYRVVDTEQEVKTLRDLARLRGYRSMLFVPLLRGQTPIGVIAVTRVEPGPFVEHHVDLLQTFADQAVIAISNVQLFQQLQESTRELSASLDDLRTAQDRLVQTEKLASLGQLTAGIAHEIKNPLNFVNNFSALSAELIEEMKDMLSDVNLDKNKREDLDEITQMLKSNLDKVVQHGKRADSIVKNMLLHSRQGSGEHRPVDINAIVDESLNLAYHGARAENIGFNITMHRSFDPAVGMADGYPQEITRALLNLISNGFYAAKKRKADAGDGFEPTLTAATKNLGDKVEIRIRDNGTGIPAGVKEKIFNPFFTTKPAGEGTGLGLSMSHDIIVKQHGGTMDVDTVPGVFTEFKIVLPRVGASLIKPGEPA
jgi:two-component system NtrC family sensor kinase